jgi:hypothetical protein
VLDLSVSGFESSDFDTLGEGCMHPFETLLKVVCIFLNPYRKYVCILLKPYMQSTYMLLNPFVEVDMHPFEPLHEVHVHHLISTEVAKLMSWMLHLL